MKPNSSSQESQTGVSRVKLALGAASLFLFIVGLKRTFRSGDGPGGLRISDEPAPGAEKQASEATAGD